MVDLSLNERKGSPDRLQIAAMAGLMLLGAMFVYSATMRSAPASIPTWIK